MRLGTAVSYSRRDWSSELEGVALALFRSRILLRLQLLERIDKADASDRIANENAGEHVALGDPCRRWRCMVAGNGLDLGVLQCALGDVAAGDKTAVKWPIQKLQA